MIERDSQLLCTFSTSKTFEADIEKLCEFYSIPDRKIYVIASVDKPEDIFLTFNASRINDKIYPRTISVHRKKDHNTLYSINALRELVSQENSGSFSSQYSIDWDKYSSSIVTIKDGKLKVVGTKLLTIRRF